ncbi:MAG TPA: hypothetical protein VG870_06655, partial [Chitinophagaceae bacterium]|nr:hypothetical protein [Chitinophagaceae bacterium]
MDTIEVELGLGAILPAWGVMDLLVWIINLLLYTNRKYIYTINSATFPVHLFKKIDQMLFVFNFMCLVDKIIRKIHF